MGCFILVSRRSGGSVGDASAGGNRFFGYERWFFRWHDEMYGTFWVKAKGT